MLYIYVDGISSVILEEASAILFADDMALYRPIHTPLDYELLQKDIDAITRWISAIHMQFNAQKCKFMLFSRKRSIDAPPVTLSIDGIPLQKADAYKYLGVFLTSDLNWSFHINTICSKTKKLVGLFHRKFFSAMDVNSCILLYKAFIRPNLEYACQVWDPHLKKDIAALESVQKFALRACTKSWDASYDLLLSQTNLPSLQDRRAHLKICTLYKIVYSMVDFPDAPIRFDCSPYSTRSHHSLSIASYPSKSNQFSGSFFPSSTKLWNSLSYDVISLSNFLSFKKCTKP